MIAARAEAFIYWTNYQAGTIARANLDGSAVKQNAITNVGGGALSLAIRGAYIYWTNPNAGSIGRVKLDGTAVDPNFITGGNYPIGIATDAAYIYWTNYTDGSIGRAKLDGSEVNQSFIAAAAPPDSLRGLAVNGASIYYVNSYDLGAYGAIGRANIDGSGADPSFITDQILGPEAVALDSSHIYWSPSDGSIGRANLDGSAVNYDFAPNAGGDGQLAVDAAHIYWTGQEAPIGRANIDGSGVKSNFIVPAQGSYGLALDGGASGGGPPPPSRPSALSCQNPGTVARGHGYPASPRTPDPTNVANGVVSLKWRPPARSGSSPVSAYCVAAEPDAASLDLLPASPAQLIVRRVDRKAGLATTFKDLVADCHTAYTFSVAAINKTGISRYSAPTAPQRPSGIVRRGPPSRVVVILDGIGSQQAGFQMDPYHPTSGPGSYCPQGLSTSASNFGNPVDNAFRRAPAGPWEFFAKWNYFDPHDNRNGNVPAKSSNSTPRGVFTGLKTHRFMLDAVAATGAVILPYSYWRATLTARAKQDPLFVYDAYTNCNATPVAGIATPIVHCSEDPNPDAGGFPDPGKNKADGKRSFSLDEDVQTLNAELVTIKRVWPDASIVVMGHSQGGLIAFEWWRRYWLKWGASSKAGYDHTHVSRLFSLDSPINGVCATTDCFGPPGYPDYGLRDDECLDLLCHQPNPDYDPTLLALDRQAGEPFRFIGTVGDHVVAKGFDAYGPPGEENLQHQLLFQYGPCEGGIAGLAKNPEACPAPAPPDHISDCPITDQSPQWVKDDAHFIEKFCPGNAAYFDQTLGLPVPGG